MEAREKVLEETKKFRAKLPELMKAYEGRWVVFLDGEVKGDYAKADQAYVAAVEMFGPDAGFVVAPVEPVQPMPVTAGVLFGIA